MSNGTPPDTEGQAALLADLFLQFSMALDDFRATAADLSDDQAQRLGTTARQLDELSDQFNAAAIGETLQGIQPNLNNIIQTTKDAQQAIKTIKAVQKIMAIGGAALTLATAIAAGNPSTIISAVGALATVIAGGGSSAAGGAGGGAAPAAAPSA